MAHQKISMGAGFYPALWLVALTGAVFLNWRAQGGATVQANVSEYLWVPMFAFAIVTIAAIVRGGDRDESGIAWWIVLIWAFVAFWSGVTGVMGSNILAPEDGWLLWGSLIIGAGVAVTGFIHRMRE